MKSLQQHLIQAIANTELLKTNKTVYLKFIKNLLDFGIDPNCLYEAKKTKCNELQDLLLKYGARLL